MSAIAETPATELGSMIVHSPDILGGKPRIQGHRVVVWLTLASRRAYSPPQAENIPYAIVETPRDH